MKKDTIVYHDYHSRMFQRGFSLVELLVVIFIISVTAGILLASYGDDRAAKELEASSREFAGSLREAQNYALTGKKIGGTNIPCGYKVTWTGSDYSFIYYSRSTSDPACQSPPDTNTSLTLYSKTLKRNAVFMSNSELTFTLPHGIPCQNGCSSLPDNTPFPIILNQDNAYHVVCIDNKGRLSDHSGANCPS